MWGEDRSECSASGAASGARVVMGRFCDRLFNRLNSLEVSMGVLRDDRSQPGFDLTKARAFGKSKGPRPIGAPFTGRISGDFFCDFSHGFFQPKIHDHGENHGLSGFPSDIWFNWDSMRILPWWFFIGLGSTFQTSHDTWNSCRWGVWTISQIVNHPLQASENPELPPPGPSMSCWVCHYSHRNRPILPAIARSYPAMKPSLGQSWDTQPPSYDPAYLNDPQPSTRVTWSTA